MKTDNRPIFFLIVIVFGFLQIQDTRLASADSQWVSKSPMPATRCAMAGAVVDGKVYVMGGLRLNPTMIPELNTVVQYDPMSDSWAPAAPMSATRAGLSAAVVDDKIYAMGGFYSTLYGIFVDETNEQYDPPSDTWSGMVPMATARAELGVVAVNDKIYAIGGWTSGMQDLDVVEEYDPVLDSWTAKTSMPTARRAVSVAVLDGEIWVIGGLSVVTATSTVEIYNATTDSWRAGPSMPTARYSAAAVVLDRKIYVMGGREDQIASWLSLVEVYDAIAGTWSTGVPMPTARAAFVGAVVDGNIYAIGGQGSGGQTLDTVEMFGPQAATGVSRKVWQAWE